MAPDSCEPRPSHPPFCLEGQATRNKWRPGVLGFSFWSINLGLALMVLLSLLPIGLLQTWASVEHGLW